MFGRKTISSRKIGEMQKYDSYKDIIASTSKSGNLFRIFVVVFCIVVVWFFGKYIIRWAQVIGDQIGKWAVTIVSESLGTEMKKDAMGNVNIMILWYGWKGHAWNSLADSIMVASWNHKLGAVTMLSVPRDLYVNTQGHTSNEGSTKFLQ